MAVIVLKEGGEAPDDLRKHLSNHFAKWELPERIEYIDEIPRTAIGNSRRPHFVSKSVNAAV